MEPDSPSSWNDIKGKGLGRLLHFLSWYCDDYTCDNVRAGWSFVYETVPTMYGTSKVPYTDDYREYVERKLLAKKAHGFLTVNDKLLCYYWWEGDTDIPRFEFAGEHAAQFTEAQENLREKALADQIEPPSFGLSFTGK